LTKQQAPNKIENDKGAKAELSFSRILHFDSSAINALKKAEIT
jgi:hypothetical protein